MRIVFMGTPAFAVPTLDALVEWGVAAGHEVVAAYTRPPRAGGRRGRQLVASPVQRRAEALGIEVRSPARLRAVEEQAAFTALGADVAVVAAYGLILPQPVLDAPRLGCLNVHASLLPRWRGAAPIQRAILAGDDETGVCVMQMEVGLDTGPVRLAGRLPIDGRTAGELTDDLATLGARLMVATLADLDAHPPTAQATTGITHAAKIDKGEARIDWSRSAVEIERLVRAMNPAPGAWMDIAGERVKLLAASARAGEEAGPDRARARAGTPGTTVDDRLTIACGDGALRPTLVQRAGRGMTSVDELLRGFPVPAGTRLS